VVAFVDHLWRNSRSVAMAAPRSMPDGPPAFDAFSALHSRERPVTGVPTAIAPSQTDLKLVRPSSISSFCCLYILGNGRLDTRRLALDTRRLALLKAAGVANLDVDRQLFASPEAELDQIRLIKSAGKPPTTSSAEAPVSK
jgi:hypothetical protein